MKNQEIEELIETLNEIVSKGDEELFVKSKDCCLYLMYQKQPICVISYVEPPFLSTAILPESREVAGELWELEKDTGIVFAFARTAEDWLRRKYIAKKVYSNTENLYKTWRN